MVSGSEHAPAADHKRNLQIQYLGCGGVLIRHEQQAIMIDPYFSHQRFMKIGKSLLLNSKIKPLRNQIAYGKKMIQDSLALSDDQLQREVKGIFSAHGHYDHLMDIPFIYNEWLNKKTPVFVNSSAYATCAQVIDPSKLRNIEKIASIRNQVGNSIEFVEGDSKIRVYPIFADHNPHSRNIKLFAGSATETPAHFKKYDDKTYVNDWLEGQTMSFLIDLVAGNEITFRIFIQSSSCQFPNGMPPDQLLTQKKIDVALLGIASYQFSENTYPCKFLEKLKPQKLIFIHWEDFFSKYEKKAKAVRKNNIPRLINEVFPNCKMPYSLPVPGSVFSLAY